MNSKLHKPLIILALETLLEQLVDSREDSDGNWYKIREVEGQIKYIKEL